MQFIEHLTETLSSAQGGSSVRKILSFLSVFTAIGITIRFTTGENLSYVLGIWLIFALVLLGLVTFEQIIKLKNGGVDSPQT